MAQDLNERFPLDTQMQSLWLPAIRAQLALNRNNPAAAISALGGQIPYHWIDLLRRHVGFYSSDMRQVPHRKSPDYMLDGPICVLINGVTQSGGDVFSELIKTSRVAKLIGSRTKGDMAGAGGVYIPFVDGGSVSLPTVGFFDSSGQSIVEGEGVHPDIEVADDPTDSLEGPNPQLDRAIKLLMEETGRNPASH